MRIPSLLLGFLIFLSLCLFSMLTRAQAPLALPNVVLAQGGIVYAMVRQTDGKIIVGGAFTMINNQPRSNLARLNADGTLDTNWTIGTDNKVGALAIDNSGNLYVGGKFDFIGGVNNPYLAKLSTAANGSVDTAWTPLPDDEVRALVLDGSGKLYVGGDVNSYNGVVREYIARISATGTGAVDTSWNANADDSVYAIALDSNGVYVGGAFSDIGGAAHGRIARLLTSSGVEDATWNLSSNGVVYALQISGTDLIVGGLFTNFGGQARNKLVKVSSAGVLLPWNPDPNLGIYSMVQDGSGNLYIGGAFTTVGGVARQRLAKILANGNLDLTWSADTDAIVRSVLMAGTQVLAGGDFVTAKATQKLAITQLSGSSGALDASFTAHVQTAGKVNALVKQANGGIIVGGQFIQAGGIARQNLLRLNANGALDSSWQNDVTGASSNVYSLASDSASNIYVGGIFSQISGVSRANLARILANGSVDASWAPNPDSLPNVIRVASIGDVFVGGFFGNIGGQARASLAKLSANGSGAADAIWNPAPDNIIYAMEFDSNGNLLIGGDFTHVGAASRLHLARVPLTGSGAADSFDPGVYGRVNAIGVDASGSIFVGGGFTMAGSSARSNLVKLNSAGVVDATWNPGANGTSAAILPDSVGNLYLAGYFTSVGGVGRNYLAKLSASGAGTVDASWNPNLGGNANAVLFNANGEIVTGGNFSNAGGQSRVGVAAYAVLLIAQTIIFNAQTPATQGFVAAGSFSLNPLATGGASGNAVTYSTTMLGVCTINGSTVTIVNAGTCTIAANQTGNSIYSAATQVTQSITIGVAPQTINFAAQTPAARAFVSMATFAVNPQASGGATGNAILYSSTTAGVCTISATTVTMVSAGTCTIAANQAGNANYSAAPQVTQSISLSVPVVYMAPGATGSGTIAASFIGGGAACNYTTSQFIPLTGNAASPPAGSAPPGVTFVQGLFDFRLGGCANGSTVTFTITYPSAIPAGAQYWKYGPTPGNATPHWYTLPSAVFTGNSVTFTITDGGLGDDDLLANGTVIDQGGPGIGGGVNIPTLSEWALLLLAGLMVIGTLWVKRSALSVERKS